MFNKACLLFLLCGFTVSPVVYCQETETILFSGIPKLKISEGGINRIAEDIKAKRAMELKCTITKVGEKYFWTTRNNIEMIPIRSGGFLTFLAVSGAGYARIILPGLKDAASLADETAEKYDYVEHMLIGLKSVTYYGKTEFQEFKPLDNP